MDHKKWSFNVLNIFIVWVYKDIIKALGKEGYEERSGFILKIEELLGELKILEQAYSTPIIGTVDTEYSQWSNRLIPMK